MTTTIESKLRRAAQLNAEIKKRESELKALKEDLVDYFEQTGDKKVVAGDASVTFVVADVFNPIDISQLYDTLKRYDKSGDLFQIVKADMAAVRRVLPASDIATLQGDAVATKISVRLSMKPGGQK